MAENNVKTPKQLSDYSFVCGDENMHLTSQWFRITRLGEGYNSAIHKHSFYEIHYCLCGTCEFVIDQERIILTEGKILLVPPLCEHLITGQGQGFVKLVLGVEIEFLQTGSAKVLKKALEKPCAVNDTPLIRQLIDFMCENAKDNKPLGYMGMCNAVKLFLLEIAGQTLKVTPVKMHFDVENHKKKSDLTDSILQYISDNISSVDMTSGSISKQFNISTSQLNRIFQKQIGKTVSQHIAEEKYKRICQLLETTDSTLHHISTLTGFSNEYNMMRFFKKHAGFTPGTYKKLIGK